MKADSEKDIENATKINKTLKQDYKMKIN